MKQIEEVFGVDASAPAGGMMMAGPAAAAEEVVAQTDFDLVITEAGQHTRQQPAPPAPPHPPSYPCAVTWLCPWLCPRL